MKLSQALPAFLTLATAASPAMAINEPEPTALTSIPGCGDQAKCLQFEINEVETDKCLGQSCEYEVCVKTYFDKNVCPKPSDSTLDHICKKPKNMCLDTGGFKPPKAFLVSDIPTYWKQCQHVAPGGKAEFLFHDGSCAGTDATVELGGGVVAQCHPRPLTVNTCTDMAPKEECWWRIYAPTDCPTHGGTGGDPHIMRWNGKRFSYHGECDLVMIHSKEFGEGLGLDLHIRTTIDKFYSFVESMAVKIGGDMLEINSEEIYFNGNLQSDLPSAIADYYPISEEQDGANRVIRISLHNGDRIEVKIYKKFLAVNVAARKADFGNSVGLLGDFHTGAMLARDGETVIELDDEFGAEWQVRADEPKLFHDSDRSPQLPAETCRMPAISAARGLRNDDPDIKAAAEKACADKPTDAFDFCVFDVIATGDVGMAGAW